MNFAIYYILFFTLDILFASNFQTIGMLPMNFLFMGVAFFFLFIFLKKMKILQTGFHKKYYLLFSINIMLLICFHMLHIFIVFKLIDFQGLDSLMTFLKYLIFFLTFIIIIIGIINYHRINKIIKWIFFILFICFVKFLLLLMLNGIPVWFFRWGGILDILMLFGLLVIIDYFLKKELNYV